ncbi:MAG TPA: hypothetical protein VH643_35990 [Gemmataceae bacterium]|jgi:hypothetical protein
MLYFAPLILAAAVPAQAPPPVKDAAESAPAKTELAPPKKRHALILCGHPGDAEHVKSFTETVRKLADGLTKTLGIPPERQYVLFGADRPKDLPRATGPATREAVADKVTEVRKAVRPEDGLWVICLGHCHHDGRQAWWNLPGPDLNAAAFGKLFADLTCREQVFVMTTSLSGYFLAPLSRPGRVVITATEADAETNETTFPRVFAQFLADGMKRADHDVDKDGKLSLFDLYVVVAKEIAQNYASAEQLATEHQQLDDDGDRIGHEPQNAYLPEEQGGTPPGKKSSRPRPRDGLLAARLLLSLDK